MTNALQRVQRRIKRQQEETCRIREAAQCVACGDPLDGESMIYCFESGNGFHVPPTRNL